MLFAGEATCDNLSGYTHGALLSGQVKAAKLLHAHYGGPKTKVDPCTYWPDDDDDRSA